MMPNHTRGGNMAELLRYLYGPGKAEEHTRPHLVYSSQPEPVRDQKNGETLTQRDVKPRADYLEERRRLHEKVVKRWLNEKGEKVAKDHPGAKRQDAHVLHAVLSAAGPRLTAEQKKEITAGLRCEVTRGARREAVAAGGAQVRHRDCPSDSATRSGGRSRRGTPS